MTDIVDRLVRFNHKIGFNRRVCLSTDLEVEAAIEIDRLRAENEKLRAALKPFADVASKLSGDATDWSFFANGCDLRAAAAALKEADLRAEVEKYKAIASKAIQEQIDVRKDERERCAKIAETCKATEFPKGFNTGDDGYMRWKIAAAIRDGNDD